MFTVVVPLFQKRHHIMRTLETVVAQTRQPSHVLVIDDGSTDGGGDAVRRGYPDVEVVRQPNSGVGAARNLGIARARTDWIALLDADDLWLPHHLAELGRIINFAPDSYLVSTQHEEATTTSLDSRAWPTIGRLHTIDYFREASRRSGVVWTSSTAIRRSVLRDFGGFGEAPIGEDTQLWARIALRETVTISEVVTAIYVRGVGGAMEQREASSTRRAIPRRHTDVSPSCAVAHEALEDPETVVPRSSLLAFVDARVIAAIRNAIVRNEARRARALGRLLPRPLSPRGRLYRLVLLVPVRLVSWLLPLRRSLGPPPDTPLG